MVIDGGYASCGEHWIMYKIAETLCYTHETNMTG